jgi:hypothetical protein
MSLNPLSSEDAAERTQFLMFAVRFGVPAFILLTIGEGVAAGKGWIPGWLALVLFVVNVPIIYAYSALAFRVIEGTAQSFTRTVYGAGNLPPEPAHSGMESLVARGFYPEAEQAFRQWIVEHPDDNIARIKLADLERRYLKNPEAAERLYLDVRGNKADPRHVFMAWNLLIELYREMGRQDRLLVEVARFADRYANTRAGRDARRLLKELKEVHHRPAE